MEAVACELVRRDIVADCAGLDGRRQQVPDEFAELLLRSRDVLTSMKECHELAYAGNGIASTPAEQTVGT